MFMLMVLIVCADGGVGDVYDGVAICGVDGNVDASC